MSDRQFKVGQRVRVSDCEWFVDSLRSYWGDGEVIGYENGYVKVSHERGIGSWLPSEIALIDDRPGACQVLEEASRLLEDRSKLRSNGEHGYDQAMRVLKGMFAAALDDGCEIGAAQVLMLMKMARILVSPSDRDSYVDLINYAAMEASHLEG